jgi:hypothetical protein
MCNLDFKTKKQTNKKPTKERRLERRKGAGNKRR